MAHLHVHLDPQEPAEGSGSAHMCMEKSLKAPAAGLLTQCFLSLLGQQLCLLPELWGRGCSQEEQCRSVVLCTSALGQARRLWSHAHAAVEHAWGMVPFFFH